MARLDINVGTNANDGTGDDLRTAMVKINTNFTELYAETLVDSGISISGNTISSNRSDDDIVFEPAGTGAVRFPAVTINGNAITGTRSNEDLTIAAAGTGNLILGSLRVNGTTISSDDSSTITLAENVDITGNLQVNEISSADSSNIYINDGLNVSGTLTANSFVTNTIISSESTAVEVADGLTVAGTLTANTFITNAISSSESSAIQINDDVNISGTATATTLIVNDDNITINRRWNDDSTRTSNLGKTGDTAGMIAWEDDHVYVCTGNYDGVTAIWKRADLSSF
jgi:hypothetical protein